MYRKKSYSSVYKLRYELRYGSFSQKCQGTSVQVLIALDGISFVFFLLAELYSSSSLQSITGNADSKSQCPDTHTSFRMCQALKGIVEKLIMMGHSILMDCW